jgi:hypothetical protein
MSTYIDPSEILKGVQASQSYGSAASSDMSAPFNSSIPDMSTASSQNASKIIGGVQDIGRKMLDSMSSAKNSIDNQVMAHQDRQRRTQSYDFQPDLNDLRPTDAHGFPSELADEFFAPFMKK